MSETVANANAYVAYIYDNSGATTLGVSENSVYLELTIAAVTFFHVLVVPSVLLFGIVAVNTWHHFVAELFKQPQ